MGGGSNQAYLGVLVEQLYPLHAQGKGRACCTAQRPAPLAHYCPFCFRNQDSTLT